MGFLGLVINGVTLPETNITHENPIFLGKYHQNGGFSMAMLVYRRVCKGPPKWPKIHGFHWGYFSPTLGVMCLLVSDRGPA